MIMDQGTFLGHGINAVFSHCLCLINTRVPDCLDLPGLAQHVDHLIQNNRFLCLVNAIILSFGVS